MITKKTICGKSYLERQHEHNMQSISVRGMCWRQMRYNEIDITRQMRSVEYKTSGALRKSTTLTFSSTKPHAGIRGIGMGVKVIIIGLVSRGDPRLSCLTASAAPYPKKFPGSILSAKLLRKPSSCRSYRCGTAKKDSANTGEKGDTRGITNVAQNVTSPYIYRSQASLDERDLNDSRDMTNIRDDELGDMNGLSALDRETLRVLGISVNDLSTTGYVDENRSDDANDDDILPDTSILNHVPSEQNENLRTSSVIGRLRNGAWKAEQVYSRTARDDIYDAVYLTDAAKSSYADNVVENDKFEERDVYGEGTRTSKTVEPWWKDPLRYFDDHEYDTDAGEDETGHSKFQADVSGVKVVDEEVESKGDAESSLRRTANGQNAIEQKSDNTQTNDSNGSTKAMERAKSKNDGIMSRDGKDIDGEDIDFSVRVVAANEGQEQQKRYAFKIESDRNLAHQASHKASSSNAVEEVSEGRKVDNQKKPTISMPTATLPLTYFLSISTLHKLWSAIWKQHPTTTKYVATLALTQYLWNAVRQRYHKAHREDPSDGSDKNDIWGNDAEDLSLNGENFVNSLPDNTGRHRRWFWHRRTNNADRMKNVNDNARNWEGNGNYAEDDELSEEELRALENLGFQRHKFTSRDDASRKVETGGIQVGGDGTTLTSPSVVSSNKKSNKSAMPQSNGYRKGGFQSIWPFSFGKRDIRNASENPPGSNRGSSKRRQRHRSRRQMEQDVSVWRTRAQNADQLVRVMQSDVNDATSSMQSLRLQLDNMDRTNQFLKEQLQDIQQDIILKVHTERQRVNAELEDERRRMATVLERERELMRVQVHQTKEELKEILQGTFHAEDTSDVDVKRVRVRDEQDQEFPQVP